MAEGLPELYNALVSGNKSPVIEFNLHLGGTGAVALPDNLHVKGNADLRVTSIKALPKNFIVDGSLNITGLGIEKLPDDTKVKGQVIGLHVPKKEPAPAPA